MKPNPHIEKVLEWRDNPRLVTQEELEANTKAADAAWHAASVANSDDMGLLGSAYYAAKAAERGDVAGAWRCTISYYKKEPAREAKKKDWKGAIGEAIGFGLMINAACIEPRLLWVILALFLLGCAGCLAAWLLDLAVCVYRRFKLCPATRNGM